MRQRHIIYTLLSLMAISISPACQKVIDVDLNEAAPRIVIEGLITDRRGPYSVNISKSGSYFDQPLLETVSGALAVITDDFGNIDTLRESLPGRYLTVRIRGVIGRTYTLNVVSEEQEYKGSTTMLSRVNIDSLKVVKSEYQAINFNGSSQNEIRYEIHCFFRDPLEKNYYRIKVFKNDSINTESYRLYDDQYQNGQHTQLRVGRVSPGDNIRVELLSLDKSTYIYYRTLADLLYQNPFFGSTPANPNTNLSNGALGYFGACAISGRTIVITESLLNSIK